MKEEEEETIKKVNLQELSSILNNVMLGLLLDHLCLCIFPIHNY